MTDRLTTARLTTCPRSARAGLGARLTRAGASTLLALGVSASIAACKKQVVDELPPPESSAPAPDQLASGEVAESREELFGLALPAGMRTTDRMQFQGSAIGPLPFEDVANYVRAHVDAKNVEAGPSSTVFEAARVKRPRPGPDGSVYPPLSMRVVVKKVGQMTNVDVWADQIVPDDAPEPQPPPRREEPITPPDTAGP